MSHDDQWITAAITNARKVTAAVPGDVWTEVEALLREKLSERQLPAGELTLIAKALIESMVPAPPSAEGSG
jgi:hypothetical protein